MKDDLISRQAVLYAIVNTPSEEIRQQWIGHNSQGAYLTGGAHRQLEIIDLIDKLPTAQPELHWIPCSKRLPEDGRCLVTRYDSVTNTCFSDILWYEKGVWWNRLCIGDFAVIAWMPLPEPYGGGDTK